MREQGVVQPFHGRGANPSERFQIVVEQERNEISTSLY